MKISAVLAIKDEVKTYQKTLTSLKGWVDEIIVADIGMSSIMCDEVKKMKGVVIVPYTKAISYIELIRQDLIDKATHEWVVLIDPDEVFTTDLQRYLNEHAAAYDYFSIPRKNIILGQWMEHSRWWPDRQIRFFKKSAAQWGKAIHSQPILSGEGHEVPVQENLAIEHYNYLDYDQYIDKTHRYARAEAQLYIDRKEALTIMQALQRGLSEFMSRYFKDDGYKDGTHGFVMAFSQLLYYFQVYVYFWEMSGHPKTSERELKTLPSQFFKQALRETLHWSRVKKIDTDPISKVKEAILKRL